MLHKVITDKVAAEWKREHRRNLLGALVAGAVVAGVTGTLIGAAALKRSKSLPASGTYESVEIQGIELVEGTTVRVTFTDGWADIFAGGNNMTGTVMTLGSTLFWSEEDSTSVGCMPNIAVQDAWLSKWLNGGVSFFRDHKKLTLAKHDTKIVFEKISNPDDI